MKKQAISVLLASALMLSGAAGVMNAYAGDAQENITLTLWYWTNSIQDELLAQVPEVFPGVTIDAQKVSADDIEEQINTTIASGGELPDLLAMDDWIANLLQYEDSFVNLYDAPCNAGDIQDEYVEWKWKKAETVNGKLIGLPMDIGPTCMFYNATLFEAAGLPTDPDEVAELMPTWEAAFEAAEKLQEATPEVKMFDFLGHVYVSALGQQAKLLIDEEGNYVADQEENKNAFMTAAAAKPYVYGGSSEWDPEWAAALNNHDVAAFVGAVWMKPELMSAAPDTAGEWRVTAAPGGAGNVGGSAIGITSGCEHVEEAYQVITWLTNNENQVDSLEKLGLFPSRLSALDDESLMYEEEFFGNEVVNKYFVEAAKEINDLYYPPNYSSYQSVFEQQILLVQDSDKDPEQAFEDAVSETKDMYDLEYLF